jgi:hypothetical protein
VWQNESIAMTKIIPTMLTPSPTIILFVLAKNLINKIIKHLLKENEGIFGFVFLFEIVEVIKYFKNEWSIII